MNINTVHAAMLKTAARPYMGRNNDERGIANDMLQYSEQLKDMRANGQDHDLLYHPEDHRPDPISSQPGFNPESIRGLGPASVASAQSSYRDVQKTLPQGRWTGGPGAEGYTTYGPNGPKWYRDAQNLLEDGGLKDSQTPGKPHLIPNTHSYWANGTKAEPWYPHPEWTLPGQEPISPMNPAHPDPERRSAMINRIQNPTKRNALNAVVQERYRQMREREQQLLREVATGK